MQHFGIPKDNPRSPLTPDLDPGIAGKVLPHVEHIHPWSRLCYVNGLNCLNPAHRIGWISFEPRNSIIMKFHGSP